MKLIKDFKKKSFYKRAYGGRVNWLENLAADSYMKHARPLFKRPVGMSPLRIYDPRCGSFVESNNPALILLDLISEGYIQTTVDRNQKFYREMATLADYFDEKITIERV